MAKSGHEAGFQYAQDKGLTTQAEVDAYMGNSDSFREGMKLYIDSLKKKEDGETATKPSIY